MEQVTVTGKHRYTLFQNSQNGYTVGKYLGSDGVEFIAVGDALPTRKDLNITFCGEWTESKYGQQLSVSFFEITLPTSEDGVAAYFSSLKIGIGRTISRRIYRKFGEQVWDVVENEPRRLLSVKGITERKVTELQAKIKETRVMRELMKTFQGSDIPASRLSRVVEKWGAEAVNIVSRTPYRLTEVSGFGFPVVDSFAKGKGFPPDSDERIGAAATYVLQEGCIEGNVCMRKDDVLNRLYQILNAGYDEEVCSESLCKKGLTDAVVAKKLFFLASMLYLPSMYLDEQSAAASVARLLTGKTKQYDMAAIVAAVDEFEKTTGFELAKGQRDAVIACFKHPISVITGGPGTGKTTIIKAVLYVYNAVRQNGETEKSADDNGDFDSEDGVILMAPTGRAARRMSETTQHNASTIHSALGVRCDDRDFVSDDYPPLDADIVIVDEGSMLDQHIAALLLERISTGTNLVFVGDIDQLPSVGAGNVLAEFIRSQKINVSRLDVIYRQAEESPIIANAAKVKDGNTDIEWARRFKLIAAVSQKDIFNKAVSMYLRCVKAYGINNVILLSPMREKGALAAKAFNLTIQEQLNPKAANTLTVKVNGIEYRTGDRVMQTKNTDYAKNGDVGTILNIIKEPDPKDENDYCYVVQIEFNDDGKTLSYSVDDMQHITLAYCMTVHKSQGSEYQTVLMVTSSAHRFMLRRNLVYTGITRASENVAIIGEESAFKAAILNDTTDERCTLLADRIHSLCKKAQGSASAV